MVQGALAHPPSWREVLRSTWRRRWPLGLAAAGILASVAVVAYGSNDTASVLPVNLNLVTKEDIEATKPGTPARALLQWFQAVQVGDIEGVRRVTAPAALARLRPGELAADVEAVAPALARPEIVAARVIGGRAALRVRLLSFAVGQEKPVLTIPATLWLVKVRSWRMRDLSLLINAARAMRRHAHRAR